LSQAGGETPPQSQNRKSLKPSKNKPLRRKLPDSDFAALAQKAMLRAQRAAARENARFGLPLITQPAR
jgi:hypothetical protein